MMKKDNPTLVVIPSYNEKENISGLAEKILNIASNIDVLVVDDNSPDGTADVVRKTKGFGQRLQMIVRQKKNGRGGAVLDGFRQGLGNKIKYEYFFEMDADFSHSPDEIPLFLEKIKEYDLVIGSRYRSGSKIIGWPINRTVFSKLANIYARCLLRIPITDYTNGYRLYRREVLENLDYSAIEASGYIVLSEVAFQIHLAGYRIGEIPTVFVNRRRGLSNLSFNEIYSALRSVFRLALKRKKIKKLIEQNRSFKTNG
jgi:dolichol-phosphate mannosyltransferase